MKKFLNVHKWLILLVLVSTACVNSCKDDDDYDWNNIEAGKQRISRADADTSKIKLDSVKGDNISIRKYVAIARGGSEYIWRTSNSYLIVIPNADEPYKVDVKADSREDTEAWLWMQEKSRSGKLSTPDSMKIKIFGYCPFNIEELLGSGNFTSKMTYYAPYNVQINKITDDTLVNSNFFNMNWSVKYILSRDHEEKITIAPNQRFIYNEEMVEVKGTGTYSTCKSRMEIKYAITRINSGDTIRFGSGVEVLQGQ